MFALLVAGLFCKSGKAVGDCTVSLNIPDSIFFFPIFPANFILDFYDWSAIRFRAYVLISAISETVEKKRNPHGSFWMSRHIK